MPILNLQSANSFGYDNLRGKTGKNFADPVNPQDAATKAYVDSVGVAGSIQLYAGSVAPTGYLLCRGQAVSRETYSDLFAVIGTTYGVGDSSTTFNVPNLQGKVPVGVSDTDTDFELADTGGAKTHTLTSGESGIPSHGHTQAGHAHTLSQLANKKPAAPQNSNGNYALCAPAEAGAEFYNGIDYNMGTSTPTINNNSASNASSAHNNIQPFIALNYIIKY